LRPSSPHFLRRSVAFTYSLAQSPEVLSKSIRVNAVAPGHTWSPLVESTYPGEKAKAFGKDTPMGRPAQPEEIAPSYVFLASEIDSSYMSGQVLHPNGGMPIHG
jgi:NAD(P)-dependent dehydrogenase (short-subunit alcohol dehydrogenase family)